MPNARKPAFLAALLCPLSLLAQTGQQPTADAGNTQPEQRCILEGRVTNSLTGEPLKKVAVHLARRGAAAGGVMGAMPSGPQGYAASSEADGSFRFENIEPGDYMLSGQRTGFLNTNYGAKSPFQQGTVLTLRAGQQMKGVSLTLIPQAVITGKVIDSDGDPVENARIQVLAQTWMRGKQRYMPRNGGGTNDLGEFRMANLSPGKYYLYAEKMNYGARFNDMPTAPGKPDVRPVRTFYPGAPNLESATPVEIRAGQDLPGIDIRLNTAQTYHIRGKIAGGLSESDSERANVSLTPRDDEFPNFMFDGRANVNRKNQSFDISGVAPGSYYLNLMTMAGQLRSLSRQPVDVGAADVNDVILAVVPPGSLHGQVRIEGTPQAGADAASVTNIHVNLSSTESGAMFGPNPNKPASADGSFTLDNVSPGKYYLNANAPSGTYLKSVRFGSQEILGKELDFSGGGSGELEVVFRYGAAEVDGTVQAAQSATPSGNSSEGQAPAAAPTASIVLVPRVLNADGSGMRFANANQNGTFTMKQLPPGTYQAYAFEEISMDQMQNPDVLKQLESRATEIEVNENDKKQIQLSVISASDLQQVFARLGIDAQ